ncbi:MAG: riboflavin biosynthesis protein RibD [Candidatus Pelagibacter sp.]|nr:riboflavin biosynthesis protein RibD [Candidatus Pelagibacter sp.]|tara:strand:+ start:80 stop:1171 length:1092 start_codon:yes stop_codon:yes gene_type:complete
MASQKNKNHNLHKTFLSLAFEKAKINLGKTKLNPTVGCVLVKNGSVISSGKTSINGRPHAEYNALINEKNAEDSDLYVTMEPCIHYGLTPPCTNLIKKKGIKRVFYSFNDIDKRTAKKSKKILSKEKILVKKISINNFKNFYQSYFFVKQNMIPFMDAKIAISKDYFTIKKGSKWITNNLSRKRAHLLRSQYDCILSTSESVNKDNSLLNCRLNGFNQNKPDLAIVDLKLKIKKKLDLYKLKGKRKIFIITSNYKSKMISFLKKKGIKIILIKSLKEKHDFIALFKILKKKGYNRMLLESGLKFLNTLIKNKLIFNLYVFQSSKKLEKLGSNNSTTRYIKKMNFNNKINVNLNGDKLYRFFIK